MKKYCEIIEGVFRGSVVGRLLALVFIWFDCVLTAILCEGVYVLSPIVLYITVIGYYPWFFCREFLRDPISPLIHDMVTIYLVLLGCVCLIFFIKPTLKKFVITTCTFLIIPIFYFIIRNSIF